MSTFAGATQILSDRPGSSVEARGCLSCGLAQQGKLSKADGVLACAGCQSILERVAWRSLPTACAFSIASLLALLPAVTLPLMRTSLLGATRQASLLTCVSVMLGDGWPELAGLVFLFAAIVPIARFALLSATLTALVVDRRPRWLGPAFRLALSLETWAMTEVFLVGFAIAYLRLRSTIDVEIEWGGTCLAIAGILALFTRAAINNAEVWRAILPDLAIAAAPIGGLLICSSCAMVEPDSRLGQPCSRCRASLRRRRPYAVVRSAALIIAGALLYFPANLYPIATLPIGAKSIRYTVLEGVIDLAQAKLLGLALIVLTASFVIPVLKLAAMAWCLSSILHRRRGNLVRKAKAFHFVEEIGRWSMVDPFLVACFAPVATFNDVIYGRAEVGLPFFATVVVLTMVAAKLFDPRLLWDAAEESA